MEREKTANVKRGAEGVEGKAEKVPVRDFRDLRVYRMAFDAAMQVYSLSKNWPSEERYSLTDQIRRASRSVCANIAKAGGNGVIRLRSSAS